MKKIIVLLLTFIVLNLPAQTISERIDTVLQSELLKTSEIGVSIYDLTARKELFSYQDEKLFRPASIEKIITSITSLSELGITTTFDTSLRYSGKIVKDTLYGNLYLIGGFDPEFMEEDLEKMVGAIQALGIKYVSNSLIVDISMKDSLYWGKGWAWDDSQYSFQPYLSPLMLNRGCVNVKVVPKKKNQRPTVIISPSSTVYPVINKALSYNPSAGKFEITRDWINNKNTIIVRGNISRTTCEMISIYNSSDFFVETFVKRLHEKGIGIKKQEYADNGIDVKHTKSVITIQRPFDVVLNRALKKSDNLCAEAIFYNMASKVLAKKKVSDNDAVSIISSFIKNKLMYTGEYNIVDGSGISMYNYISPKLMIEFLKYINRNPILFPIFYNALPISGTDGTLINRMKFTNAHGSIHAKTGTVTGVSSLAGYATAKNGHLVAFVIINQNLLNTKVAHKIQDEICKIIVGGV